MRPVLVDTTVWIAWFRGGRASASLGTLLRRRAAYVHAWVLGELMLGAGVPAAHLRDLVLLPALDTVNDEQMSRFLVEHRLRASGIGWVDLQLLASAHRRGVALWSLDRALTRATHAVRLPTWATSPR